ncbi:helix-turn-helix domain-containing protein [Streptomyces longwoodensis]|uniref:helix-turn-helix domain-containing protein n=1 Tax=Streptomyces longwoodensis TaxID=68231 RepID=UPI00224F0822|nr:helix-turn-helix domain-containing protein [Streptomyces longwoodensis]MCX4993794.1 helix-turn-helix domain-containing protein [Streptomyces longwoodensis]MCX4998086.1 helix-turn-helix domain-containing protein [Streptomyces longwoodensis]
MTRRHTYPQAAAVLSVDESWLRRHIKELPHTKLGRVVYFTDADLERIDALFHHEPSAGPLANATTPAPATTSHPLSHLRPLPSRRSAVLTG